MLKHLCCCRTSPVVSLPALPDLQYAPDLWENSGTLKLTTSKTPGHSFINLKNNLVSRAQWSWMEREFEGSGCDCLRGCVRKKLQFARFAPFAKAHLAQKE